MVQILARIRRTLSRGSTPPAGDRPEAGNIVAAPIAPVDHATLRAFKVDLMIRSWTSDCIGLEIAQEKQSELPLGMGIPTEIHGEIIGFLNAPELLSLAQCNSSWMKICRSNRAWLCLVERTLPHLLKDAEKIIGNGHNLSKRVQKFHFATLVRTIPDRMTLRNSLLTEIEYRETNIEETKKRFGGDDDQHQMYQWEVEQVRRFKSSFDLSDANRECTAFISDVGPWMVPLFLQPGENFACCK